MKKLEALGGSSPAARVAIVFALAAAFFLLACQSTSSTQQQPQPQRQQPQGPTLEEVRAWAEATKYAQNREYEATKAAKEQEEKDYYRRQCHRQGGVWLGSVCREAPTPTPRR